MEQSQHQSAQAFEIDLDALKMVPHFTPLLHIIRNVELRSQPINPQIMSMPALLHHPWTEAEVRQLIEDAPGPTPRYELVDGELLVTPSPSLMHQRIVFELAKLVDAYVREHGIGELRISPSDVRLKVGLVVKPDVYVVPAVDGRRPRVDMYATHMLLAIEVVSPASARYDRVLKRKAYQSVQVAEYWIVDADARTIERWQPSETRPEVIDETLSWTPPLASVAPLMLDIAQFFADVSDD